MQGAATAARPQFPQPEFSGELQESIIPGDIRHLIFITGHRGKGKTTFCLGVDHPANILMLDYESKGEGLAIPLGVGGYFSIMDECAETMGTMFKPIDIFNRTNQILEAMPRGRFTTLFLDNAGLLQEGCIGEVKRSPTTYEVDPAKALSGQYGGAIPGVKYVLRRLFSTVRAKGVKVIVVTFQPSKAWGDGKPLFNKFKTTDVTVWHELSVLTLVLTDGIEEYIPAPSALVFKEQLGQLKWNEDKKELEVKRRLPFKLRKATMAEVYRYLKEPADFLHPLRGELIEPGEMDPWSPTFGREQLVMLERMAKAMRALEETPEEEAQK